MFFLALRRPVMPREQWTTTLDTHLAWMKEQHDKGPLGAEVLQCAPPFSRHKDLIFLAQRPFHLGANQFVVIYNQQFRFHIELETLESAYARCPCNAGSKIRKAVPFPTSLSTSILPRCASTIILH